MKKGLIEELGNVINGSPLQKDVTEPESSALDEASSVLDEESEAEGTIAALRDTDYKDKEAFFKMVELLKGLAVVAEEDDAAKKFMSKVSDELTTAAKSVLGEDVIDEGYKDSEIGKLKKDETWAAKIHDDSGNNTKWLNIDKEFMSALNKAYKSKK